MTESVFLLLNKFKLELEMRDLPAEVGGFYQCRNGKKHIVVNQTLEGELRQEICVSLIYRHCMDERISPYIPYYLFEQKRPGNWPPPEARNGYMK